MTDGRTSPATFTLSTSKVMPTDGPQLRSEFCSKLNDYRFRIGSADSSACPECHLGEHNVSHLFDCPRHPTSLTPTDLWKSPREVAFFLRGLSSFSSLPRPPPPPPLRGHRRGRPPAPPSPPAGPLDGNLNHSASSLFSDLSIPSDFLSSSSSSLSSFSL